MAKISLRELRHRYDSQVDEYALQQINLEWQDGGAYALLGPSGCGKTTLLNIISGLITPSDGQVLFDKQDVTALAPEQRNIAQVFQFPVIYDTMSVRDNLSFPLRNRGVDATTIKQRVAEIAHMLELTDKLEQRAAGLSPDDKQKISMGRGLVRNDVNVIMFDEPLTVIDPLLKWKLRSKLKQLHQQVKATMIYVTHDQTEALTFADQVIVMQDGLIVQSGTPVDLFERPEHTFVGHFIGSPGMNLLPCNVSAGTVTFGGKNIALEGPVHDQSISSGQLGFRPEFVTVASKETDGIPATVTKVADLGRSLVVEAHVGTHRVNAIIASNPPAVGAEVTLQLQPHQTRLYVDGWLATKPATA